MIERVHFQNYKALYDVEMKFGRFTVLVGANACGKSSVLEGIQGFASRFDARRGFNARDWHDSYASDLVYEKQTVASKLDTWIFEFDVRESRVWNEADLDGFDPGPESVALRLAVRDDGPRVEVWSDLLFKFDDDNEYRDSDADEHQWEFNKRLELSQLFKTQYLEFEPKRLVAPAYAEHSPSLKGDGAELTAVLAELALNSPRKLARIQADLAKVVPGVGLFRFPRETVTRVENETISVDGKSYTRSTEKSYPGHGLSVEIDGKGWISARDLSEGTVLTLGLLTALHTSDANVIMFDDLDRGLHPRAQADLIASLRTLLDERPELQIICTTHSPYLLNHFEADEVRVMGLDAHRHAHVRTLSDHPEWAQWKETMQAGEFWSVVGDDWAGRGDDDKDD